MRIFNNLILIQLEPYLIIIGLIITALFVISYWGSISDDEYDDDDDY